MSFSKLTLDAAHQLHAARPSFDTINLFVEWWTPQQKRLLKTDNPELFKAVALLQYYSLGWKDKAGTWAQLWQTVILLSTKNNETIHETKTKNEESIVSRIDETTTKDAMDEKDREILLLKRQVTISHSHFLENEQLRATVARLRLELRRYQTAPPTAPRPSTAPPPTAP